MAGLDTAVRIAYAIQASGATLYLYEELYGHFIEEPRAAKEASNFERLAKVEPNKGLTDFSASIPDADELSKQFERLSPKELGGIVKQTFADKSVVSNLPKLALTGLDKPGYTAEALIPARDKITSK
jgi:hypothetical protein